MLKTNPDVKYAFVFLFGKETNSFTRLLATTTAGAVTDGEIWGPTGFPP